MTRRIPVCIVRGGTSRGLFFRESDLPPAGIVRDRLLIDAIGAGSPNHSDGLGGGVTSTNKIMILQWSEDKFRYAFGQVGVGERWISWDGDCGNLSFGLMPYLQLQRAIPTTIAAGVPILSLNTGRRIVLRDITEDDAQHRRIRCTYEVSNADLFPLVVPWVDIPIGDRTGTVRVLVIHATNTYVLVSANALSIDTSHADSPNGIESFLKNVRREVAHRLGLSRTPGSADQESPVEPRVILVEGSETTDDGQIMIDGTCLSSGRLHGAFPATGAMCLAVACLLGDQVEGVTEAVGVKSDHDEAKVSVRHAGNTVTAKAWRNDGVISVEIESTARIVLEGMLCQTSA